jgi:hypothetical protein
VSEKISEKVLDRVRKLLRLASNSGATEAEAQLAAEKAAEIMREHGLSTATIEAEGGAAEGRARREAESFERGRHPWMSDLMSAVAKSCFCLLDVEFIGSGKKQRLRFRLFGRESATASAFALADYLKVTIWRLSSNADVSSPHYFRSGCAERLGERIRENHEEALRQQREAAERQQREAAARAAHPGAATGGNMPAVILEDYALSETELNEDLLNGLTPGTTTARRLQQESQRLERERRYNELLKQDIDPGVAYNVVYLHMSRERAEEYEVEFRAREEAARLRAKEEEEKPRRRARHSERRDQRAEERRWREDAKRADPSWRAGREKGDEVSLSRQIDGRRDRRLT